MIKIKNCAKTYKSKTAKVTTIALKNISMEIEGPQLVFIVGKSGSGKSTLLNILGGLDRFDSGEMYVNDFPMAHFSDKGLDDYRNSSVGFIFQEYNLIDDLNVEENIALAYKLQGKTPDTMEINNLLSRLELTGFNKRLVEELSGGQKQRVDIARALIKNPLLILADEPTGSLDSNTGGQILQLLKDIAKEKLVIVVSHDREYAEKYADRIIELADGEIISDVINTSRINEKAKESEKPTLRNNALEIKEIFRLGFLGMKHHKARLHTSIVLLSLALMLFGMATAFLSYNERTLSLKGMFQNDNYFLSFERSNLFEQDMTYRTSHFTKQDMSELAEETQSELRPIFYDDLLQYYQFFDDTGDYYFKDYNSFDRRMELSKSDSDKWHFNLVSGSFPSSPQDIVVTKVFYDICVKSGFRENGQIIKIASYDDLLGRKIDVFQIVGILDTNFDEEKYYPILFSEKNPPSTSDFSTYEYDERVIREMEALFDHGPHNMIYVNPGYYQLTMGNNSMENSTLLSSNDLHFEFFKGGSYITYIEAISKMGAYPRRSKNLDYLDVITFPSDVYWKNDVALTHLADNQIVISFDKLMSFPDDYWGTSEQRVKEEVDLLIFGFVNEHFSEVQNVFNDIEDYIRYIKYHTKDSDNIYHPGKTYDYFYECSITLLVNKYAFSDANPMVEIEIAHDSLIPVEIMGVYMKSYDAGIINYDTVFISDKIYENVVDKYDLDGYPLLGAILSGNLKKDLKLVDYLFDNETGSTYYSFDNDIIYSVLSGQIILRGTTYIFGCLAILMAIFAALIMYNYMVVSIQIRQKNIGIMRALGASQKDIFRIFYSESIILAGINAIIGLIGSPIAILSIDHFVIKGYLKFSFSVMSYGIFTILTIILFAFVIASISTIAPILKFSKKEPIDIIKQIS